MIRTAALLALAALLATTPARAACPAGQTPMLHVRIYFGLVIPATGKRLPDSDWQDFLARTVTPRFPSGFTVYDAMGQWRDLKTKIVGREPSRIIEVDAPDSKNLRTKVEDVRKTYQARFRQQAVGLVTEPVCASF
jgi:hypothetical protein